MHLAYGGDKDPKEFAPALQEAVAKRPKRHPSPCPEYVELKTLQRVAEWWRCDCDRAREMSLEEPYLFRCIADALNAEAEADPIAYKYADVKAKIEAEREKRGQANPRLLGAPPEE